MDMETEMEISRDFLHAQLGSMRGFSNSFPPFFVFTVSTLLKYSSKFSGPIRPLIYVEYI